jgi:hypothetical protein
LLVKRLLLRSRTLLQTKPRNVRILLHLTNISKCLSRLPSLCQPCKTLLRTKLTRLFCHTLALKVCLLVCPKSFEARLGTKTLSIKRSAKVLLAGSKFRLLVSQRSPHRLISVKPLRLKLSCQVLDISLRSRIKVSKRRLHTRLGTKLLDTELGLKICLTCRHTRCAVTLELLLRTFIRRLQATRLDIT